MKKSIFLTCFVIVLISIFSACKDKKTVVEKKEINQTTVGVTTSKTVEKEEISKILKKQISDSAKKEIVNINNPKVEDIVLRKAKGISILVDYSIVGKELYKVSYETKNDAILGPIIYYVQKNDGKIVAEGYRD
jgi:hypothetical protein